MGGFQAFSAGIGNLGEDIGKGTIGAQDFALRSALVNSQIANETARTDIARQGQKQNYELAQQQHELYRQSVLDAGFKDTGVTMGQNGQYTRTFVNPRTNETKSLPVNGTPIDSPQGVMNYYKQLRAMQRDDGSPLFNDIQAAQIAFKMPNLYREGPAGMLQAFRQDAADLFAKGVTKVRGPNGKLIDISTTAGQQEYGQSQQDLMYARAGYYHWGPGGAGVVGGKDMTGMTAGEQREFKATIAPYEVNEKMLMSFARAEQANAITPQQQQAILDKYQPQFMQIEQQIMDARIRIMGRRAGALATPGLLSTVGAKPQAGSSPSGPPAAGSFQPPGAPPAKGLPDNTKWVDGQGNVIGLVKGGQWTQPSH